MADFTGQNIQDTYQRVVQVDGNQLQDGTGSNLPISFNGDDVIIPGALRANSYIVSQSTTIATSGSTIFGNSYDDTHTFSGSVHINDKVDTDYNTITPSLHVRQDAVDRSQIANGFGGSIDLLVQRGSNASGARTGRIASYLVAGAGSSADQWGMKFAIRNDDSHVDALTIYPGSPDTTARIGIMNTAPAHTLDVDGTFRVTGDINAGGNIVGDSATTISGITTITATSNISSSGIVTGNVLKTDDYLIGDSSVATGLSVAGYIEATHVTASGNISASGVISAGDGGHLFGGKRFITDEGSWEFRDGTVTATGGLIVGNITASGDISASGTIVGSNLSGTNTGDQDLSGYVLNAITSSLLVRNSETGSFLTSIPTGTVSSSLQLPTGILSSSLQLPTGTVSSSLQLPTGILSSSLQLPTGIFSASAGGDLLLPHNAEVGYDSDNHILFGSTQVAIDATIFNINASNRVNFHDTNVGIRPSNPNTVPPEALTVEGNISSSGNIYSDNIEILAQGSARVSSITNTTDYWGPNFQGPYHTANWNKNTTPESDGNIILTRQHANTGFIVPYKCSLVGFDSIAGLNSGEDTPFSMSLFTADALTGMDLNSTNNVADGFTASLVCTGISQGSTGYNRHRMTGSCAVTLSPFSVVFPLVKVDASGNDDGAMSLDMTYVLKIKRIK